MKLRDCVKSELDLYRSECNFTDEELEYFNLKARDKSNLEIANAMSISEATVSNLARKVKRKIAKII